MVPASFTLVSLLPSAGGSASGRYTEGKGKNELNKVFGSSLF